MRHALIEQVYKTVHSYDMFDSGEKVLVAVSGGPDSIFLLRALHELKGKLGISALVVAHLDHGLRGDDSRRDLLFVRELAHRMGLECVTKSIALKRRKRTKCSMEEVGRSERYKFFLDTALKVKSSSIATGHTLDDQAETILMRIIKGCSLKGIIGIPPVRQDGSIKIVRPLIEIEKTTILKYLTSANILFRTDQTNAEDIYFRNVVRSEILPFLERYNPRIKRSLFSMAEHLREDLTFIRTACDGAIRSTKVKSGNVEIMLKDLIVQPKAIQKEVLRDALEKAGGHIKRLSFRHWKALEYFLRVNRSGDRIDLPGSIRVKRSVDRIIFAKLQQAGL